MNSTPATQRPQPQAHIARARRRLATVLVDGMNPVGLQIARHLIRAGVGSLLIRDEHPVGPVDAHLPSAHHGVPRAQAACDLLPRKNETTVIEMPADSRGHGVDLHLVIGSALADHASIRQAVSHGAHVLPVVITEHTVQVGPLLGPGPGHCPECFLAATVTGDPAREPLLGEMPTALTAALAVHQLVLVIDGGNPPVARGRYISLNPAGDLEVHNLPLATDCSCMTYRRPEDPNSGSTLTPAELDRRRRRGVPLFPVEELELPEMLNPVAN